MNSASKSYVVDVSNICWDAALPPIGHHRALASRLAEVVAALRMCSPGGSIRCIADNSLKHMIKDVKTSVWRREYREKFSIEEVPVADELILDYATREGSTVVSRDQFVDHRKTFPWIDKNPHRFIKPTWTSERVEFIHSGITSTTHHMVSRMIEAKELKQLGIDQKKHKNVLETRWRCTNTSCLQARLWQDMLLLWPLVDQSGRAHCPSCQQPVVSLGQRPTSRQFIVFDHESNSELFRFPIEAGMPIVVGRGTLRGGLSIDALYPEMSRVSRISRQHLILDIDESGTVRVRDLGSSNGTRMHRNGSAEHRVLPAGISVPMNLLDSIDVAGVIRIELSGQRFVSDTAPKFPEGAAFPMKTQTGYLDILE